jgi:hypothetical protein
LKTRSEGQTVNTQDGAHVGTTATIPQDDTIPQNTEGLEVMTLSITPNSATSKLRIDVLVNAEAGGASWSTALFQDSTANALTASLNDSKGQAKLTYYMTSGTASATTFKVRIGGTGSTIRFNGIAALAGRIYGGVNYSSITITEIP